MDKHQDPDLNIIPATPTEPEAPPPIPEVTHLPMAHNSAKNTDAWETESVLIAIVVPLVMGASGFMLWFALNDLIADGFTTLDTTAWISLVVYSLPILIGPFVLARFNVMRRLFITLLELGIVFAVYPLFFMLFFDSAQPDYVTMGAKVVIYLAGIGFLETRAIRRHFVKQKD